MARKKVEGRILKWMTVTICDVLDWIQVPQDRPQWQGSAIVTRDWQIQNSLLKSWKLEKNNCSKHKKNPQ